MSTYTVEQLPGAAWAVSKEHPTNEGTPFRKTMCICNSPADAERIAYCLRIVEESEETAARDEA